MACPIPPIDKPGANMRGGGHRYTDHQYGFWSHDTDGPHTRSTKVTIDPKSNGGERAEVSVKGISDGKPMGAGPGGNFISDVEIRYALERDDPASTPTPSSSISRTIRPAPGRGALLRQAERLLRLDERRPQVQQALSQGAARRARGQVRFHRRPIRPPRLRLVQHHQERRLLVPQSQRRVSQRRPDQGRVPLPSRHQRRAGRPPS